MKNIRSEAIKIESEAELVESTVYQDSEISVEATTEENIFYVCVSSDNGLSYDFDSYYKYETKGEV